MKAMNNPNPDPDPGIQPFGFDAAPPTADPPGVYRDMDLASVAPVDPKYPQAGHDSLPDDPIPLS